MADLHTLLCDVAEELGQRRNLPGLARALGLSRQAIHAWVKRGRIPQDRVKLMVQRTGFRVDVFIPFVIGA